MTKARDHKSRMLRQSHAYRTWKAGVKRDPKFDDWVSGDKLWEDFFEKTKVAITYGQFMSAFSTDKELIVSRRPKAVRFVAGGVSFGWRCPTMYRLLRET